jgi:hypothetical protein
LKQNGFDEDESVGEFTADLKGHMTVFAPVMSYGFTDKLTVGIGVPVYTAATSISVGFQPNDRARAFLASLSDPKNNQSASAHEAADKLNTAVARLNQKLADNGYRELNDWHSQGLGDVTVAAKYQHFHHSVATLASTTGFVAPTGRTDDPDVLNDIPFGDGQWDLFHELAVDEELLPGLVLNQFGKYTVQLPDSKKVRAQTDDEPIEVGHVNTRYKLGDKIDAGASLRWEPRFGLVSGIGYSYFRKYGDVYRGDFDYATKEVLERGTDQRAHNAELLLGYSTVPLYMAGSFAVPLDLKLTYTRQLSSVNMPVTDLAQLDFNLYF